MFARIDSSDVLLVGSFTWFAKKDYKKFYAYSSRRNEPKKSILMHRLITNATDDVFVDHIDGDGLNNTRANLRFATPSQNQHNAGLCSANTSGFKGVSYCKRTGRWQSKIKVGGVFKWIGYFPTAEDASDAYARANSEFHGEFGRLS
jgi:hypothetical protein